jgi:hypothetical protein
VADEGRNIYWPIMIAACIGALGTVAAAVVGRFDVGNRVAPGSSATPNGRRATAVRQAGVPASLPADWIDARGRYYTMRQSGGGSLGIIAYDGGARALAKDHVRLTGDGTSTNNRVSWTWADSKAKLEERCTGRATASAITLHCAREGEDGYDLRLIAR